MAKGSAEANISLVSDMMAWRRAWPSAFLSGAKMKPMPPPAIPPSIQKPQKSGPNSPLIFSMSVSV